MIFVNSICFILFLEKERFIGETYICRLYFRDSKAKINTSLPAHLPNLPPTRYPKMYQDQSLQPEGYRRGVDYEVKQAGD
jgi:hypothetical protein